MPLHKCAYCGKELKNEEAVVVERLGYNDYYCPEHKGFTNPLVKTFQIVKLIIGETALTLDERKLLKFSLDQMDVEKAYTYLCHTKEHWIELYDSKMRAGDFKDTTAKIKYLMAILRRKLPNYQPPKARSVKAIDSEPIENQFVFKRESNSQRLERLLNKTK